MQGPTSPEQAQADLDRIGTIAGVARAYGMPRATLANRLDGWGIRSPTPRGAHKPAQTPQQPDADDDTPGCVVTGDTATITLDPGTPLQPDQLLTDHGLDADEWVVTNARPNSWQALAPEGEIVTLHQLKVEAVRRIPADALLPARTDGWTPKRTAQRPRPHATAELVAIVSDTHAPYHDPGLHDCFLQWLQQYRPERAYDFGDLLDLPTPSRHRTTQGFEATPQESIDTRYQLDAERVAASPSTEWRVVLGNHDERLDHAIRDKIGAHVARIARAGDTLPVMDLGFLLRYDELGINLIRPDGDYHALTVEIAPGLFGRHGTKAGKHGGAVKAIERRDASLGQGHDHKQLHQQLVRYDDAGVARSRWMMSWGAMCSRDLGYVEDPDVAQGFTSISVHADGSWHPEMARWDAATDTLYWRDERYQPR
jgi:hypothetical protein